jgi:D-alanine--poly(phosphoribitol) ligase subunit 2
MSERPDRTEERGAVIAALRGMLQTLAENLGTDASGLEEDDMIPDTGILDSAGIIEFVMTFDNVYELGLQAEDMTIDNLGSLSAIAAFIAARRAGRA